MTDISVRGSLVYGILKENRMIDRCVRKDSLSCAPSHITRDAGFASGSGYEESMGQTPCCIIWSTHNHGINDHAYQYQSRLTGDVQCYLMGHTMVPIGYLHYSIAPCATVFYHMLPNCTPSYPIVPHVTQ